VGAGVRELSGQVAVVTGAARGIGLAAAEVLAALGAHVVMCDRDADSVTEAAERLRSSGRDVSTHQMDVASEESVGHAFGEIHRTHRAIDILVNNAGVTGPSRPVWETSSAEFSRLLNVHLLGTFYCVRAVVPTMIRHGYGRIVNVASVAAKEGNAGSGAYSAAKAGVVGLTKALGKELATSGVLVNAITPGVTETALLQQSTDEHIDGLIAKIPMGRVAQPAEVAEMIAWASSPRCSFTTGSVFDVSGGRTTY
jgi:NAD(P)-dependent dehydrogenase (short-subunit alcohol dehydrogenase family)